MGKRCLWWPVLLVGLLWLWVAPTPVHADQVPGVFDQAGVLTKDQVQAISEANANLPDDKLRLVVLTTTALAQDEANAADLIAQLGVEPIDADAITIIFDPQSRQVIQREQWDDDDFSDASYFSLGSPADKLDALLGFSLYDAKQLNLKYAKAHGTAPNSAYDSDDVKAGRTWLLDPDDQVGNLTKAALAKANDVTFAKVLGHPQIAVSVKPANDYEDRDSIAESANTDFNTWGVGKKGWDNGLLFEISPSHHVYWLEVGYGLEGVLPDGAKAEIITPAVTAALKAENYDYAVAMVVDNASDYAYTRRSAIYTPQKVSEQKRRMKVLHQIWLVIKWSLISALIGSVIWAFWRLRYVRRKLSQQLKDPTIMAQFKLYQGLAQAKLTPIDYFGGGSHFWRPLKRLLPHAFATAVRHEFINWASKAREGTLFYPYFYYRVGDVRLEKIADEALIALPSLQAISTLIAPPTAQITLGQPYAQEFAKWVATIKAPQPDLIAEVWRNFLYYGGELEVHTKATQLRKTWTVMYQNMLYPAVKQELDSSYSSWVSDNYSGGVSSSSGSSYGGDSGGSSGGSSGGGFGGGFGGGSSGGGGFGGSW